LIHYDVQVDKNTIRSPLLPSTTSYSTFQTEIAQLFRIPVNELNIGWQLCTTLKKSPVFNELTDVEHYNRMILAFRDAKEKQDAKIGKGGKVNQRAVIRIEDRRTAAEKVMFIYFVVLSSLFIRFESYYRRQVPKQHQRHQLPLKSLFLTQLTRLHNLWTRFAFDLASASTIPAVFVT
jgi:hypothetical protein